MGIIDTVIIILLSVLVVTGFAKGFIKQIFSIGAWALAIIVPITFTGVVNNLIGDKLPNVSIGTTSIIFVGLFIVTFIIIKIIGHSLGKSVQKGALGWVDRLLGLAWGLAKGLIIICVFFLVVKFLTTLPLIGNTVLEFISKDLELEKESFMVGRYLYNNNLLLKLLEFIK